MNPETPIMQRIRLAVGARPDVRIVRNNTGVAWAGNVVERTPSRLVLLEPRLVRFGLCVGSPDLVGWHSVVVPESWVGTRVARFVGLEVKQPKLLPTPEQASFLRVGRAAGGILEVVHSPEEALRVF